jgi:hypothetical protein
MLDDSCTMQQFLDALRLHYMHWYLPGNYSKHRKDRLVAHGLTNLQAWSKVPVFMQQLRNLGLMEAVLTSCIFSGADLRQVSFSAADLSHSNFTQANLRGVNLRDTILTQVYFERANLQRAVFDGAYLCHTCFDGARLDKTHWKGVHVAGHRSSISTPQLVSINNIGRDNRTTTYRVDTNEVWCGCFHGNLSEFKRRVHNTHRTRTGKRPSEYRKEYDGAIAVFEARHRVFLTDIQA